MMLSTPKLILHLNTSPTNYLPKVRRLGFSYAHLLQNSTRNEKNATKNTNESMTQPKGSHMQIDTLYCQQKELGYKGEQRLHVCTAVGEKAHLRTKSDVDPSVPPIIGSVSYRSRYQAFS